MMKKRLETFSNSRLIYVHISCYFWAEAYTVVCIIAATSVTWNVGEIRP
jgi:hypothetical protein